MKKYFVAFISTLLMTSCATTKVVQWEYEVEPVQLGVKGNNVVGERGTYLFKVWSYAKNANQATELAKKNAVHAVIFKGAPGQKPLANNPNLEEEKKSFFEPFFSEGKYLKFVSISSDGSISPKDRLKVGKRYKIGIIVSVNHLELRKDLESAGIIKKMAAGFAP